MPIQAIQNRRLYQQIADRLRTLIEAGEYEPGSTLPSERDLSIQFGVSRTSVREALIALEVIGLVSVRAGSGVVVKSGEGRLQANGPVLQQAASLTPWELDPELDAGAIFEREVPPFSLLEARRLVEPEAAALAATRATDEQLAAIREAYYRNVEDNRSGSHTHPGDRLFHIRIAEASDNPAYAVLIRHLLGHKYGAMFQRLQELYTPQDMAYRSEEEHRRVLLALEAHDAAAARRAMRAHLDAVIRIFSRAAG
jgi:GntR family transcriptional repressor for pyruvate dehydrogenase complex